MSNKQQLNIRIDQDTLDLIRNAAEKSAESLQAFVGNLIKRALGAGSTKPIETPRRSQKANLHALIRSVVSESGRMAPRDIFAKIRNRLAGAEDVSYGAFYRALMSCKDICQERHGVWGMARQPQTGAPVYPMLGEKNRNSRDRDEQEWPLATRPAENNRSNWYSAPSSPFEIGDLNLNCAAEE